MNNIIIKLTIYQWNKKLIRKDPVHLNVIFWFQALNDVNMDELHVIIIINVYEIIIVLFYLIIINL